MTLKPIQLAPNGTENQGFVPSNLVAEQDFTTKDRTELICALYDDEQTGISAGVWECAPCREKIDAYPVNEMMTVLGGSVTLTGADGSVQTFGAGETFFIPKGTPCVWQVTETLRKTYMIAP